MEQGNILHAGQPERLTVDAVRLRTLFGGEARHGGLLTGDGDMSPGLPETAPGYVPGRPAAVLVPLVQRPDEISVLLTRRTDHLYHHPGQISFPGGRIEADDLDDPVSAALRETEEETGIPRDVVEVIGRLSPYRTRTGFSVVPVIGLLTPPFETRPDPFEVAEIFEVPLSFILDRANHQVHSREGDGVKRSFYVLPYMDYYIWGATAAMLVNLANIVLRTGED
ncbi:CoA pyrophosphatase [Oceanibaculum indicum]|uniref:8-oxo-dGTP pyrophosphatase MutT (NUDIX family) n=1 Tax=Oceanibaculum indicum TaxID=526216 RepID=A0A420WH19_9PROT|nr:CoA pyrophosphatase [Oceanibaculum indicum]RKQ70291.1 8-oxo-dGTP pyrophosphatase MutT (NUDIX family) [Oceanibaculum indicum]